MKYEFIVLNTRSVIGLFYWFVLISSVIFYIFANWVSFLQPVALQILQPIKLHGK